MSHGAREPVGSKRVPRWRSSGPKGVAICLAVIVPAMADLPLT
jgi:hypothetical protein